MRLAIIGVLLRSSVTSAVDLTALNDTALAALKVMVDAELGARLGNATSRLGFAYPHKQTFATSDPAAAARFVRDNLGGHAIITKTSRTCADGSLSGYTHIVNFKPTAFAPQGFSVHFVNNPHKPPQNGSVPNTTVNATSLGEKVEAWRDGFEQGFDQFMDTHLGLAFDSLDPIIELWTLRNVPYICRTWCCGSEHSDGCPNGVNTVFCEQGCYVEAPHGIIIEALCGLSGGQQSAQQCLTKATPSVFDLCSTS